ncbi:MAG: class I SAM-dependent methyltransferase [Halobacteriales archaeon]
MSQDSRPDVDAEDPRQVWAARSGEFSPEYYAYYGPNEVSELLVDRLDEHVGRNGSVLELGCSAGRHLARLRETGYEDLSGLDVNPEAFDVMARTYPELAARVDTHVGTIGDLLPSFATDRYDAIFAVETFQHLPPDEDDVFRELRRVAGELVITVEIEGDRDGDVTYVDDGIPLYHRDWRAVLQPAGFEQIDSTEVGKDTLRVFDPGTR